ncbi:MAG: actin-binding WH2 domain-containing protein [Cyanobacteria bacterium J06597_1]
MSEELLQTNGDRPTINEQSHNGQSHSEQSHNGRPQPAPPQPQKSLAKSEWSAKRPTQNEISILRDAIHKQGLLRLAFYFLDYVLRAQTVLFEQIYSQKDLKRIIISMSVLSAALAGLYGITMGMNHSVWQVASATIKLPLLLNLTMAICLPSLYIFNILFGQKFRFYQTVALMQTSLGAMSIMMASLAPIAFFFTLTTKNYSFLLLMHVAIFGLCGCYGVNYLYRGCLYLSRRMGQSLNTVLLRVWIVLYAIVGMQLAWRLRPFIGSPNSPFQFFRDTDGNFYISVWRALTNLISGS